MTAPGEPRVAAEYTAACLDGDLVRAHAAVLDAVAAGLPIRRVAAGVVAPAMVEVGDLWERGELGVAGEHLATAITQALLARLAAAVPEAGVHGGLAVVASAPGDAHTLGARIVADELTWAGWEVRYLGGPTSADAVLAVVEDVRPALLVLSCTIAAHAPALAALVTAAKAIGDPPVCVVGGQAGPALRHVGADVVAPPGAVCADLVREVATRRRAEELRGAAVG